MRTWPDKFIHTCVTSPPYWGLRDYGVKGQLGIEKTPEDFISKMVEVFREVHRVLRDDGTLWLNLGDSYNNNRTGGHGATGGLDKSTLASAGPLGKSPTYKAIDQALKPKDLIGMPWRIAFALQADGWYLRSDIIWSKPNPMPESVTDRPTKAHEYLFLLSKSEQYFYDAIAIKEHGVQNEWANGFRGGAYVNGETFANGEGGKRRYRGNFKVPSSNGKHKFPSGWDPRKGNHKELLGRYKPLPAGQAHIRDKRDKQRGFPTRRHQGFNDRWDQMEREEQCSGMRNKRSVWTVATSPFPEAHFATFPIELIKPCILAGAPLGGVVLDPFMGAGTTALAAAIYGRHFIGCELNPEYAAMAKRRVAIELAQMKFI